MNLDAFGAVQKIIAKQIHLLTSFSLPWNTDVSLSLHAVAIAACQGIDTSVFHRGVTLILSYGQLEMALCLSLGIHPDRVGTFRARIKQFQRLQFPSGVNVGRGTKMSYTGEHLFKLATAFQLVTLGQPAMTAANIVESNWKYFASGYGIAIRNNHYEWPLSKRSAGLVFYFRITINTLAPLMGEIDQYLGEARVDVEYGKKLIDNIENDSNPESLSFLLLSASSIMESVISSCNRSKVSTSYHDEEFSNWYRQDEYAWWLLGELSDHMNVPND